MRSYWLKIVSRALGVFAAGMVLWFLFGRARSSVENVIDSAVSLTIPLPFDIVPFQVDGERLGSLKKLVIHRDAPREVNWLEVDAELADASSWDRLSACRLSLDDFENLDEHSTFVCHSGDEALRGYVEFGEIRFRDTGGESLSLWVPREVAREMRHADRAQMEREQIRMVREQVRIAEEQARLQAVTSAEVAATVARAMKEAFGDSIPASVLEELRAAGIAAGASEVRVSGPEVRVEVRSADSSTATVEVQP